MIKINTEKIFLFSIFFLLLSFIIIFLIYIFRERHSSNISNEYKADRIINTLIDAVKENKIDEFINENNEVLGFGIYNSTGNPIIRIRNTPEFLKIEDCKKNNCIKYNKEKNSIIYFKPLTPSPHMMRMPMMNKHNMMKKMNFNIAYIELKSSSFYKKRNLFNAFSILIPIIIIILSASFIIIYNKNLKLKKVFENQNEMAKLGEISRTLAHEIKNPLSAMRIQTGYLQKILPKKYQNDVNPINEEIDRLKHLTDKIGDLLRNPQGKPIKINPIKFIEDVIKNYNININISSKIDDKINIYFDNERFRSVCENIIVNAIESIVDIEKGKLDIIFEKNNNKINISFFDNGQGLSPDYKENIFEAYYTTKTKGSGLGLSITKRFVESANGKIQIKPRNSKGTEVKITLPIYPNE